MPRIELRIDNYWHQIDTPDYQMCGQWIADHLQMARINPTSMVQLKVDPALIPDPRDPGNLPWIPDWNCDSRTMETFGISDTASPADAARKLAAVLQQYARLLDGLRDAAPQDARPV